MNLQRSVLGAAIALFAAAGVTVAASPPVGALLAVATFTALALMRLERPAFVGLLALLVVQDPLQILVGSETNLALAIKYLDEPLILLGGAACLAWSRQTRRVFATSGLPWAVAVLYLALALSTALGHCPWFPALFDAAMFSKPFMLLAIGMSVAPSAEAIDRGVRPTLAAMIVVVLFGLIFLAAPGLREAYMGALAAPHERLGRFSAQGFFRNPGTYSWFAAATFACAYAAYLVYRRFTYLVAAIVAGGFVLLSLRRKSILAVLAILAVTVLVRAGTGSRVRAFLAATVTAFVAITILASFFGGLWTETVQEYGRGDPMATARQALYAGSMMIARDKLPLGTGWGTFGSHVSGLYYSDVYREYGLSKVWGLTSSDPAFITDTFWPMVLGQGGVLAVCAYLAVFLFLIRAAWRESATRDTPPSRRFVALAALCLLVGSLVESSASHVYGASLHAALALVPAGIAWRIHVEQTGRTLRFLPSRWSFLESQPKRESA